MRTREITQSFRIDETELAQLHALAGAEDMPIGRMLRRWLAERYTARFGSAEPPAAKTKAGVTRG